MSTKTLPNTLVANRSYVYLLPMIALSHNIKLSSLVGFMGAYLYHEDFPQYKEHLFLHFKVIKGAKKYQELEKIFRNSPELVLEFQPEIDEVMFCFKVPVEYKAEFDKFLKSKYSEFSDNYKKSILRFHDLGESSDVASVIYKKEQAYKVKEEFINKGLPESQWVRIPRDQEIGFLLEEIVQNETFASKNK